MKWLKSALNICVVGMIGVETPALAQEGLRCNQQQTFCVVENKRLTIGDEILVLNRDEEIVAHGRIAGMKGEARRVNITKRMGRINQGAHVRTNASGDISDLMTKYRVYRKPTNAAIGIAGGLTSLNVAGQTTAYGMEAFYQQRFFRGSLWTTRGHFFTASGSAGEAEYGEQTDFSITGTIVYGGLAYEFFRKQPFTLRTEANLGVSYIGLSTENTSSITFAADSAPPEVDKIGAGLGLAGRLGAEVGYTGFDGWMPFVTTSFEQINQANGVTLGAGIIKAL